MFLQPQGVDKDNLGLGRGRTRINNVRQGVQHRIDEGRLSSNQIALGVFILQDYLKKASHQVVSASSMM